MKASSKNHKRQVSDDDIASMIGDEFVAPPRPRIKIVRQPVPERHSDTVDFHGCTEEQAWGALVNLVENHHGAATVITGASGILKEKFQQWATESIISDRIVSIAPINRGSFRIVIKRKK